LGIENPGIICNLDPVENPQYNTGYSREATHEREKHTAITNACRQASFLRRSWFGTQEASAEEVIARISGDQW
jgi:hypothetical protein